MKVLRFLEGFVLGGLVGGAVTLLFAPDSGPALREQIIGEVRQAALERRSELEQQLTALRAPRKAEPV